MLEHVLAVGGAQPESAHGPDELRGQAVHPRPLRCLVAGGEGPLVGAGDGLGVGRLDALRVDAAIGHERLERDLGDLAALGVEAGQHHGVGGVVDQHVDTGERLEGADVPPLLADDPALHLLGGKAQHGDRRLGAGGHRRPLHRGGDDPLGLRLGGAPRVGLGATHLGLRLVRGGLHRAAHELGSRLLGGQPGCGLEQLACALLGCGALAGGALAEGLELCRPPLQLALTVFEGSTLGRHLVFALGQSRGAALGVGQQGSCLAADLRDVLGRLLALRSGLASGDQHEQERHQAHDQQGDDDPDLAERHGHLQDSLAGSRHPRWLSTSQAPFSPTDRRRRSGFHPSITIWADRPGLECSTTLSRAVRDPRPRRRRPRRRAPHGRAC